MCVYICHIYHIYVSLAIYHLLSILRQSLLANNLMQDADSIGR